MNRTLAPEWLDELPADDRQAIGSRRDLRRLNGIMRHPAIVSEALFASFPARPPYVLAELGAGDGSFLLRAASLLAPRWPGVHAVLVDRRPAVPASLRPKFELLGWTLETIAADVFDWLEQSEVEAAVANLFLHHFAQPQLTRLLRMLSLKSTALVACEPRRASFPLCISHLLRLVGCNSVTRHDAPISVRAGFRGRELTALWPDSNWRLRECAKGLFSHLFVARRSP